MNEVEILIISNKFDFTTDYVCLELNKRGCSYLRINRDDFCKYNIILDILNNVMQLEINGNMYAVTDKGLKAIYYRAPIYLRDNYKPNLNKEEQLFRTQWAAFIRNLTIFESAIWLNNPISTYKAENKMLQLKYALKIGFRCPKTTITNCNQVTIHKENNYIVKSLDTAVLRIDEKEAFIYSNVISGSELEEASLNLAPIILQDYIYPKTDVRVTIIGKSVHAVKILKGNNGVDGDWRTEKNNVEFVPIKLPDDISDKCILLLSSFNLAFGAIDLILSDEEYYFIEINPTGEWAWLVDSANQHIYIDICNYLLGEG